MYKKKREIMFRNGEFVCFIFKVVISFFFLNKLRNCIIIHDLINIQSSFFVFYIYIFFSIFHYYYYNKNF
jgi:hypothetical protein